MKLLILCAAVILTVVWAEYPANLPKCSIKDDACMVKAGQEFVDKHYSGVSDLNLITFDPLHIKSMILEKNPSSPVNVQIKFADLDLIGLKTMKISSFKASDIGGRTELTGMIPELTLKGKYEIDGKVLILPIVGNGASEVKCKNIKIKYSFDVKPIEKNGKTYGSLDHVKLEIKPETVQYHFANLFNGDKALGDNMNKFLNENWSEIFEEIRPRLSKALSLEVKSLLNNFFGKYPYAEYFL